MTLYELTESYLSILSLMEEEEIDMDAIRDTLEAIDGAFEDKAESYAVIMQSLQNDMDAIDKELDRLKSRREVMRHNKDNLKDFLESAMRVSGKTKFKTSKFTFAIQKNGGTLPVILKVDPKDLPTELQNITIKANNKAIAEYIEKTGDTSYAELGERGESLRIR